MDSSEESRKLEEKIEQVRKDLEEWAFNNWVINPGEQIVITLVAKIVKRPTVLIEKKRFNRKPYREITKKFHMTDKDWGAILGLEWKQHELFGIQSLRKFGNRPTETNHIWYGYSPSTSSNAYSTINTAFWKYGLPYRLVKVYDEQWWPTAKVQLQILEETKPTE